jgi:C4-dicarboxylate-specific signal transduction histidine kinase
MNQGEGPAGQAGVRFFSKMSASISHDIKNVLAVINENAGLLDDFCLMVARGKPLEPDRVKRLAGDIQDQVRRGDQIVATMNKFAHSADSESMPVDLGELLDLLAALSQRPASMRGVRLEIQRSDAQVSVTTSPFVLLNLLWLCLDYAMTASGPRKTLEIAAEKTNAGARLCFRKLAEMGTAARPFPGEPEYALVRMLNAQIRLDTDSKEVAISLPDDIQAT